MGAPPDVPAHFQSFLAFDFGLKRTGVASGNRLLRTASPQPTIRAEGAERLAQAAARVGEWQPDALVVGVPFHPDGASHENTARARKFARQLAHRTGKPVYEVDERYSTTEALAESETSRSALRGRPGGGPAGSGARDADAAAACVILEQFLRSLP